jgi:hypothetical protein
MTVPMEVQIPLQEALVVLLYAAPIQLAGAAAGLIVYLIDTTRQKSFGTTIRPIAEDAGDWSISGRHCA